MKCIECSGKTKVVDTRENDVGCYRRHECLACKIRFSTIETGGELSRKISASHTLRNIVSRLSLRKTQARSLNPGDIFMTENGEIHIRLRLFSRESGEPLVLSTNGFEWAIEADTKVTVLFEKKEEEDNATD